MVAGDLFPVVDFHSGHLFSRTKDAGQLAGAMDLKILGKLFDDRSEPRKGVRKVLPVLGGRRWPPDPPGQPADEGRFSRGHEPREDDLFCRDAEEPFKNFFCEEMVIDITVGVDVMVRLEANLFGPQLTEIETCSQSEGQNRVLSNPKFQRMEETAPDLSVFENVHLPLGMGDLRDRTSQKGFEEILDFWIKMAEEMDSQLKVKTIVMDCPGRTTDERGLLVDD